MRCARTFYFVLDLPSKLREVDIRKKIKIFILSKMARTIFIKFCGFIIHSNPKNMALSDFPEKILVIRNIIFFIFYPSPNVAPKPTGRSRSHSIPRVPLQISLATFFVLDLPPKLRVVHIRKKF